MQNLQVKKGREQRISERWNGNNQISRNVSQVFIDS